MTAPGKTLPVNLPAASQETRDSIAAEIVAGQAKERMLATLKQGDESPVVANLPPASDKTRDSIAAEIVARAKERQQGGHS